MSENSEIQVDIVSDVMCPWCYIGKKRFDKALQQLQDFKVVERWRPFQLDATIPGDGKDRDTYLREKFGSSERAREIYYRIESAGLSEGIKFSFDKIKKSPNTLNCHRLIKWAQSAEKQNLLVEELFRFFFIEGRDLTQNETLVEAARNAGMDANLVDRLLNTDRDIDLVYSDISHAHQMGVNGVPVFIVNSKYAIVGAESSDSISQIIRKAAQD